MADGSIKFDTAINQKGFKDGVSSLNKALDRFVKKTDEVGKSVEQNFGKSKSVVKLENEISKTQEKIKDLASSMEETKDLEIPTNEYVELEKRAEKAGQKLEKLLNRQEKFEALGKSQKSQAWKSLAYDIEQASKEYDSLSAKMQDMQEDGTAFHFGNETEAYKKKTTELESLRNRLSELKQSLIETEEAERQEAEATKEAAEKQKEHTAKMQKAKKVALGTANAFSKFSKALLGINDNAKMSNKTLSRMKSMFLFSMIHKAISGIKNAFKEGMQNLVQYSDAANRSMSELSSSSTYMKNSLAAAFAPILSVAVPTLSLLISYLGTAINYVNQFFSALGGSTKYTKAVKTVENYAAGLKTAGSEAKKATAPFDDLVQIQRESSGSSGGSGTDASSMFTEDSIETNVSNFTDQIKALIADGDWLGVGKTIGDKINEAVDSIDYNVIGNKIGFGINSSILVAYGLLNTVCFNKIGVHIAELLNSSLSEIDFYTLGRVVGKGFVIMPNILIGFLLELDWSLVAKSFYLCLLGIFDEGIAWSNSYDWYLIGTTIWYKLKDAFETVDWGTLASTFFTLLGTALRSAALFLNGFFGDIGSSIKAWWDSEIRGQSWEETASNLLIAFGKGFLNIGQWAIDHIVDPFFYALLGEDVWLGAEEVGKNLWEGFCKGIEEFFDNPINFIKQHITDPFVNGMKGLLGIHSPSTVLSEVGSYTVAGFNEGVEKEQAKSQSIVKSWAEGIATWFSNKFGISNNDATESRKWATSIMSGFNSSLKSQYTKTQPCAETWAENIRKWFVGTDETKGVNERSWMRFSENIIQAFISAISSGQELSKTPMESWAAHSKEWFWGDSNQAGTGGMYADFYNMAKRINEGFANGISDFAYLAKSAIQRWAEEIMEKAEEEFDIHSPSREFRTIAEYVVEGFNNGISDMIGSSQNAAERWLDGVFDIFDNAEISIPVGLDLPNADSYIPQIATGSVIPYRLEGAFASAGSTEDSQAETMVYLIQRLDELIAQLKADGNQPIEVVMNLTGNLASLARILKPELDKEAKRKGVSLVITGGV